MFSITLNSQRVLYKTQTESQNSIIVLQLYINIVMVGRRRPNQPWNTPYEWVERVMYRLMCA